MAYYTTGNQRQLLVSPYQPDKTEKIGNNTGQLTDNDLGKAVKLDGDAVVLCDEGAEIYGFITSRSQTKNGYSIGGVVCDVGREMIAVDLAGGLAVGDLVVAKAQQAFGTAPSGGAAHVKIAAGTEAGVHKWQVVGLEVSPSTAYKQILIRKV